jgi:glycosyltransferase involved in cell wall biosynthesis
MRLSGDYRLCNQVEPNYSPFERLDYRIYQHLEQKAFRNVDTIYAPSQFLADYMRRERGVTVQVLRPPLALETEPSAELPNELPKRYLFHFGNISELKGAAALADALPIAWRQEPDLQMVWAGREKQEGFVDRLRTSWGERQSQVVYLGPLERRVLYGVLRRAAAAVLPSRVDNLPNTALESLMFSVPVIGSRGASIDEIVEHGVNGELVEIGDTAGLAASLVRAWRGQGAWEAGGFRAPAIFDEMKPDRAVANFLKLAGVDD